MFKLLLKEKILSLSKLPSSARKKLKGTLKITNKEEFLEDLEYVSPEFWKKIDKSRSSGRVSGETIKKELGI